MQSHPLLMSQKLETQGCQWYGVKGIKSIFVDKEIEEQGLGHSSLLPQVALISQKKTKTKTETILSSVFKSSRYPTFLDYH